MKRKTMYMDTGIGTTLVRVLGVNKKTGLVWVRRGVWWARSTELVHPSRLWKE